MELPFFFRIVCPKNDDEGLKMNLQPDLDFCPECEAKLEHIPGELFCPNCGWEADEVYLRQYETSHGYAPGSKNP